ncbi:MAG: hypothetical protein KC502_10225 [Myxococcales bacterium]|nr:hypothetical protein [Myxococcales bacterium]
MAYRDFLEPDQIPSKTDPSGRGAGRTVDTRLVGGDMALRRANGHPSNISGEWLYDPIFKDEDLAELKAWCSPDDPRPLVVEIGFQRARFARAFCLENPGVRYMGFEVRKKFCEDASEYLVAGGVDNARLALVDARQALPELVPPGTLDTLLAFFPDPWWKKRHMKKRLVSRDFAAESADLLKIGGKLIVKTDVEGYADWAEEEMRAEPRFEVTRLEDPAAGLPPTQRERRCAIHGRPTWAMVAIRRT